MTSPIRMVSVPVEPTPKMLAATWDHEIDKNGGVESQNTRNARIYSAMLTAAPVREEGGAVDRSVIIDAVKVAMNDAWCDITSDTDCWPADIRRVSKSGPVRLEYQPAIWTDTTAEMAANIICAALATREEAPAEAGDEEDMAKALAKADGENPDAVWFEVVGQEPPKMWARYLPLARVALRAQPQAREEAQPVGLDEAQRKAAERAAMDAGAYSWRNCRLAMVEGDKIVGYPAFSRADMAELARLYTTPPAPEAEKLRVAVEALKSIKRHSVLGSVNFYTAVEALAILQQEGR